MKDKMIKSEEEIRKERLEKRDKYLKKISYFLNQIDGGDEKRTNQLLSAIFKPITDQDYSEWAAQNQDRLSPLPKGRRRPDEGKSYSLDMRIRLDRTDFVPPLGPQSSEFYANFINGLMGAKMPYDFIQELGLKSNAEIRETYHKK